MAVILFEGCFQFHEIALCPFCAQTAGHELREEDPSIKVTRDLSVALRCHRDGPDCDSSHCIH